MKRVLKNGYKNIKILNTTERYTLKNGYNGKFYVLCLLPQFFLTFEKKKKVPSCLMLCVLRMGRKRNKCLGFQRSLALRE
jgi:hypothetical protein